MVISMTYRAFVLDTGDDGFPGSLFLTNRFLKYIFAKHMRKKYPQHTESYRISLPNRIFNALE